MDENMTVLFKAAEWNNIPEVQSLLKKSIDLNYVNSYGDNALNIAIVNNHEEMVRFLLTQGAILNNTKTQISPLNLAINFDLIGMAGILIDLGANLEVGWCKEEQVTPLLFAISNLKFKFVKFLINKGANTGFIAPQTKTTLLHEIGSLNPNHRDDNYVVRLKIAKLLLRKGANVTAEDKFYLTPLDLAISHSIELSKLFIKEGAAVRRQSGKDKELLFEYVMYAVNLNNPELVRLCLERGGDYCNRGIMNNSFTTPYHQAVKDGSPEVIKVFWQFGCPFDLSVGMPPGSLGEMLPMEWCNILVGKGNMKVFSAQVELMKAIKNNDLKRFLSAIKKGAEPKGTSRTMLSTLHYLATTSKGDYKIAKVLLEKGVPVNKLDLSVKKTCLFFALINNNLNITKELLKFGVCFKKQDLHTLSSVKNREIHQVMKDITNAFKLTRDGSTKVLKKIKSFIKSGNKNMAKMMMNCVDWRGRSLMNLALVKGHTKLAEGLMKLRLETF